MEEDLSELERYQLAKNWLKENSVSIVTGAALAVILVGGWRYWEYRVAMRGAAASALFVQLGAAVTAKDAASVAKLGAELMDQYDDTPYAARAAFTLAQQDVDIGKTDDAVKMLDWVLQYHTGAGARTLDKLLQREDDDGLKLLAHLRLARIKLGSGSAQAALDELAGVEAGGFAPLYDELRGDAYAQLGKPEEARTAYQNALKGWTDDLGEHSFIDMKLNSLPTKVSK